MLRSGNLRSDDSFCVARSAAVDALVIFGRTNERRHGVHVGGKNDCWAGLLRRSGINIRTLPFGDGPPDVVAEGAESLLEKMPDRAFISGDGLDVNQLACESNDVDTHAVGKA